MFVAVIATPVALWAGLASLSGSAPASASPSSPSAAVPVNSPARPLGNREAAPSDPAGKPGTAAPARPVPNAGEPMERFCHKCFAAAADDSWLFCPACGAKLPSRTEPLFTLMGWPVTGERIWLLVGLSGQLAFALRFVIQWLVSERRGESVIPPVFWWISLVAGAMVLAYGIHKREPVVILSQAFNPIIYVRNLLLLHRRHATATRSITGDTAVMPALRPGGTTPTDPK